MTAPWPMVEGEKQRYARRVARMSNPALARERNRVTRENVMSDRDLQQAAYVMHQYKERFGPDWHFDEQLDKLSARFKGGGGTYQP